MPKIRGVLYKAHLKLPLITQSAIVKKIATYKEESLMAVLKKFVPYIENAGLNEKYNLNKVGSLSFHWANWKNSVNVVQDIVKESDKARLNELEESLYYLKDTPVWLRSKLGSIQTDLYHLYENYLDPRLRYGWFDREEEIFVSLGTDAGPYTPLKLMRWFDREIYAKFIFIKLIKGVAPVREFRLGIEIEMLAFPNGEDYNWVKARVKQITEKGILLYFPNTAKFHQWKLSNELVFQLEFGKIAEGKTKEKGAFRIDVWNDLYKKFRIPMANFHQGYLSDNLEKSNNGECYFFIPYNMINFDDRLTSLQGTKELLEETMYSIDQSLKKVA